MFWGFKVRIYIMCVSVSMSMMYICMCVQLHEVCDVRLNMYMCMYILEKLFIMCICTCDVKVKPKSVKSISQVERYILNIQTDHMPMSLQRSGSDEGKTRL